jgi:hypothetical protein
VTRDEKQLVAATIMACLAALCLVAGLHCAPVQSPTRADATDATWNVAVVTPGFDAGPVQ